MEVVPRSGFAAPDGYFSVFKELADITVMLIRSGANLGSSFIPDIGVGQPWGSIRRLVISMSSMVLG